MICQYTPSFDASPTLYWILVYAFSWVVLGLAIRWPFSNQRIGQLAFLFLALILLLVLRLPTIVYDQELNPDESQMIAQALTLHKDPVYFRSVDGTTGGPLNSYLLLLPAWFGLPFDYITAHLMAYFLIAISLSLFFVTARRMFGDGPARLSLMATILLLGLTQDSDLLHYNSELIAVALLSGSYYLLVRILRHPSTPSLPILCIIGLLLGMVPFGKLQGVPPAMVVGLLVALHVLIRPANRLSHKIIRLLILVISAFIPTVLFVIVSWQNGVYNDFVTFYLMANFQYGAGVTIAHSLLNLPHYFGKSELFGWYVILTFAVWVMCALSRLGLRSIQTDKGEVMWLVFLVLTTVATVYSITRTGSEYVHYLFFLIIPLGLWMAWGLATLQVLWESSQRGIWLSASFVMAYLLLFSVKTGYAYLNNEDFNPYPTQHQGGWKMPISNVAKKILQYAQPGEPLAVWGWRCDYYVQTQMPQGVAENHTIRSVFDHPLRADYQSRYLANIVHSFPPVFVDAVGQNDFWLTDRKTQGHEVYPPLGRFIASHYRYVGLVDDSRIYVRNDRIQERSLMASGLTNSAPTDNSSTN